MNVIKFKAGEEPKIVKLPKKHDYKDIAKICELKDHPLDCITRIIGGEEYDIWLDDEGLIGEEPKCITAMCVNGRNCETELLVGSVMVAKGDAKGNTIGLDDKDIINILKHCKKSKKFHDILRKMTSRNFSGLFFKEDGDILIYGE